MERARSDGAGPYLVGRHAVITGGGSGIGAAVADRLARLGASITLLARDLDRLDRHAVELRTHHGAEVGTLQCDVADPGAVSAAFEAAGQRFGDVYVLVNNAGQADSATFAHTSPELWERMLTVNLTGTYLCTREVLPAMLEGRAGRIVNVASVAALKGYPRTAAYAAAKAGVLGLTRALAAETAKHGVTVNAVCPGYTETAMADAAVRNLVAAGRTPDEARQALERLNPRGTLVTPAEVADAVAWLCSPGASGITGQAIAVAAGEVM